VVGHGKDRASQPPPDPSLSTDLYSYLPLDAGGGCFQPQRGGLAKPRPTAWVRRFTLVPVLEP